MTREEAIRLLTNIKGYTHITLYEWLDVEKEALDMAIEALQTDFVRCKDCKHRYVSGNGTTQYYVCDFMDAQYEDDGFCHHGKSEGEE